MGTGDSGRVTLAWDGAGIFIGTMPDELIVTPELLSAEAPLESAGDEKRRRWFELCLVLLISLSGSFLRSLYIFKNGKDAIPAHQDLNWMAGILHEVICLFLLGYVLSRRRLRFKDLGLRWSLRDLGTGLAVALVSYLVFAVGYIFIHFIYVATFSAAPGGATAIEVFGRPTAMTIPFSLLNPFFEELIVRAYLMTEVKSLTGSWTLSIALSVLVQFSYHLYYGWVTALALSLQFLTFALYYAWKRRATPVIVAHEVFDLLPLIRTW
jgi:membrane protease YdiL (CAAX protease family)